MHERTTFIVVEAEIAAVAIPRHALRKYRCSVVLSDRRHALEYDTVVSAAAIGRPAIRLRVLEPSLDHFNALVLRKSF